MPKLFIGSRSRTSPTPTIDNFGGIEARSLDFQIKAAQDTADQLVDFVATDDKLKDAEARQSAGAKIAQTQLKIQLADQEAQDTTSTADEYERVFSAARKKITDEARKSLGIREQKFVGEKFNLIDAAAEIRQRGFVRGRRIDSARADIVLQEAIYLELAKDSSSPGERQAIELEYFEKLDGAREDGIYSALDVARLKVSFTKRSTENSESKIFNDEVDFHVSRLSKVARATMNR